MTFCLPPIRFDGQFLYLIDQRKLPLEEEYVTVKDLESAYYAIRDMVVRGAPLIGFTGIWGMVLYSLNNPKSSLDEYKAAANRLSSARPTAVNLVYEINRTIQMATIHFQEFNNLSTFSETLIQFANQQFKLLESANQKMAEIGHLELLKRYGDRPYRLMTLCNTGFLACGPLGTALGVVSHLKSLGKIEHVYASETRPYLQGARLTAYELSKQKISHEVFVEGASSHILKNYKVDAIFIGADRIVANGDTANKVGSSSLSIVAKNYGVPFFVVAPTSSFDLKLLSGDQIEIELRSEDEIHYCKNNRITPLESRAINPSFDVTDHRFISGIICEKGLIDPSKTGELLKVVRG